MDDITILSINERLRQTREEKEISQRDLARRAKIGQKTLRRIENGEMYLISPNLPKIAKQLNLQIRDPLGEELAEVSVRGQPVPVWDGLQAAKWAASRPHPTDLERVERIVPQQEHSETAFAMRVGDSSMEHAFQQGDIIVVDPARIPETGKYVVAKLSTGPAFLRKYAGRTPTKEGAQRYELHPIDKVHEVLLSDEHPDLEILGLVIEKTTPLG